MKPCVSSIRLLSVVAALLSACGQPTPGRDIQAVDTTLACPEGQVGWSFSDESPDYLSSEYDRAAGDGGTLPLLARDALDITSATCDGSPSPEINSLRTACGGRKECRYVPACPRAFNVGYTCSNDTADAGPRTASVATLLQGADAGARNLQLSCPTTALATDGGTARKTCVPKFCRGATRRDTNLACVRDLTMPTVLEAELGTGITTFTPKFAPFEADAGTTDAQNFFAELASPGSTASVDLFENNIYRVRTSLDLPGGLEGVPMRLVVWFSDEWVSPDNQRATTFRCVGTTFDVTGGKFPSSAILDHTVELSRDCFSAARDATSRQEALRKLGTTEEALKAIKPNDVVRTHSTLHVSFDLEGRTLLVPSGFTAATACSPNPSGFFYDSATRQFDQLGYYLQRSIDRSGPSTYPNGPRNRPVHFKRAMRVEMGPLDLKLRGASVSVPVYSQIAATVPLDFQWYAANQSAYHPYRLDGDTVKDANLNLRAEIYLVPSSTLSTDTPGPFSGGYPLLAKIPLTQASPTGSTVSVDAPIPEAIKRQLFEPSKLYIPPDATSRAYRLLACIVTDSPTTTFEPHHFYSWVTPRYTVWPPNPATMGYFSWSLGNEADAAAAWSPFTNVRPGRGCRFSKTPLVLVPDRFVRQVTPNMDTAWPGQANERTSGDDTMSGAGHNDAERTCDGGTCTDVTTSQAEGSGQFGRSYYATTTRAVSNPGPDLVPVGTLRTNEATLSGNTRAEVLGYQVLDPGDDAEESTQWDAEAVNPEVTFGFKPPFEAIENRLNAARGVASNYKWKKGPYAGAMGIGLGIGVKMPIQIGPVPGMIIITLSAGVSLEVTLNFRWRPDGDGPYPCVGTSPCYRASSTAQRFGAASASCMNRGGRLAEFSSQAEADEVRGVLSGLASDAPGTYWLGSQLALRFNDLSCQRNWNAQRCSSAVDTSYRWLRKDVQYALKTGTGVAAVTAANYFGSANPALTTTAPFAGGLAVDKAGTVRAEGTATSEYPALCRFEPAARASYLRTTLGLKLGVGAGLGFAFCIPNDSIGVCVEGNMNVISLGIQPSYAHTDSTLFNAAGQRTMKISNDAVNVDWSLNLFEGAISATIHLYWTSFSWDIVTFAGYKVAGGSLYSYENPSTRSLQP